MHILAPRGVADIVPVTMPRLSKKDLAVSISTRVGPAEDDPLLHNYINKGRNQSRLFVRERVELLIGGDWELTLADYSKQGSLYT